MMRLGLAFAAMLVLAVCQFDTKRAAEVFEAARGLTEADFAAKVLNDLQITSFEKNREFCGYVVRTPEGALAATVARKGRVSSCRADLPPEDHLIVASYHTHGAFEYDTPAEFPSVGDVEADEAEGIDGYVSTPGGRLWYVDGEELIVSQICNVGCFEQDPNFEAGLDGVIEVSYSVEELRVLEAE